MLSDRDISEIDKSSRTRADAALHIPPSSLGSPHGVTVPAVPIMPAAVPSVKALSVFSGFTESQLQGDDALLKAAEQLYVSNMIQQLPAVGVVQSMQVPFAVGGPNGCFQSGQLEHEGRQKPKSKNTKARRENSAAAGQSFLMKNAGMSDSRVVWAKAGKHPWWPAKVLREGVDPSFPPPTSREAILARAGSQPVRFFGTYDVHFIGTKRHVMEWEKGIANGIAGNEISADLTRAIAEAQTFISTGMLPQVFYQVPSSGRADTTKRKSASASRNKNRNGSSTVLGKERKGNRYYHRPQTHLDTVQQRKGARLRKMGLMAPSDSPYSEGRLAYNDDLAIKLQDGRNGALT